MVISCLLKDRSRTISSQDAIYFDIRWHIAISVQQDVDDPFNGQEGPRRDRLDFFSPEPGRT
jgi:hypothetical protein